MTAEKEKLFLCIEDGERFYLKATDTDDAKRLASYYNASVLKEVPMSKITVNPNTHKL